MKRLRPKNLFSKDLKRITKRGYRLVKLNMVMQLLQREEVLPSNAYPHKLTGVWIGKWECHIESDWLLIYEITPDEIMLHRTGTHADLFE